MVLLYVILGHALELYRTRARSDQTHCCAHESGPAVVLGMCAGLILRYGLSERVPFSADVFFFFVLPPIIFAQGYTLRSRSFWTNFHHIFVFGIVGTLLQFVMLTGIASALSGKISATGSHANITFSVVECLLLAAVLSPSDEVAVLSLIKPERYPQLGSILFGEGVLNDALSIVLFRAVFNLSLRPGDEVVSAGAVTGQVTLEALYLLALAVVLGVTGGLLVSLLFKRTPSLRRHPVRQTAIVMLAGYLVYGLSEAADMSGITALFFASITMAHYAWHSMSPTAQTTTRVQFETLATLAEAFAFTYLGLSVFSLQGVYDVSLGFSLLMLGAVIAVRATTVFALVLLGRALSPGRWRSGAFGFGWAQAGVVSVGGMVRGAIAWAQVLQIRTPNYQVLITTTMIIVLFTTIVFGAAIPMMLQVMQRHGYQLGGRDGAFRGGLPRRRGSVPGPGADAAGDAADGDSADEGAEGGAVYMHVSSWWHDIDRRRLQPLFGGPGQHAAVGAADDEVELVGTPGAARVNSVRPAEGVRRQPAAVADAGNEEQKLGAKRVPPARSGGWRPSGAPRGSRGGGGSGMRALEQSLLSPQGGHDSASGEGATGELLEVEAGGGLGAAYGDDDRDLVGTAGEDVGESSYTAM
eukprot:g6161.t1